ARDSRVPQNTRDGFVQIDTDDIQSIVSGNDALDIARHARGLAQNDIDRNVYRTQSFLRIEILGRANAWQTFSVGHAQLPFFGRHAHDSIRATLALSDLVEAFQIAGGNG